MGDSRPLAMLATMEQSPLTMSSREIADLTGKRHDNVMPVCRSLRDAGVCPEIQETPYHHAQNGQTYTEFLLNKRDSLVLIARLSPEFTGRVIDRWQELEAGQVAVPRTLSQALRLAADQAEQLERQQHQLEQQQPAVEFVQRFVECTGLKGFREVCKLLRANEARFREFVLAEKIMYRLAGTLTAYQNHIDAGRFEVRAGIANQSTESEHAYTSTKFTPKGVDWIAGEWARYQLHHGNQEVAHG